MNKTYIISTNTLPTDVDHHNNRLVQADITKMQLIPVESNRITFGSGT